MIFRYASRLYFFLFDYFAILSSEGLILVNIFYLFFFYLNVKNITRITVYVINNCIYITIIITILKNPEYDLKFFIFISFLPLNNCFHDGNEDNEE